MTLRLAIMIAGLLGMQCLAAEVPALSEYAYGFPVLTEPTQAEDFHSIEVPLVLYQSVTDPGLRDIGVYDAAGRPVPRVLRPRKQQPPNPDTATPLPVFALPNDTMASAEDIRLLLRRQAGTTNLELNTVNGGPEQGLRYLVDTQKLTEPLTALAFSWGSVNKTFVATVNVEGSQDLDNWVAVGSGAIAHLRGDVSDIQRRRVAISGRYDYLRVSVSGVPEGWTLKGAEGIRAAAAAPLPRRWVTLDATGQDEDGGQLFDLGGHVPVDRVQVIISGDNSVVRGRLFYRSGERWANSKDGVFYNLRRDGAGVSNEAITVPERRSRHWKLKVITGRSDGPIQLKLGWRPENLVFLAQGQGPYTLAAGRAADLPDNFPQARLFGDQTIFDLTLGVDKGNLATARLGPRQLLGGTKQLAIPVKRNWQQGLLWAALILAVVVVGVIAVNLLRQLDSAES